MCPRSQSEKTGTLACEPGSGVLEPAFTHRPVLPLGGSRVHGNLSPGWTQHLPLGFAPQNLPNLTVHNTDASIRQPLISGAFGICFHVRWFSFFLFGHQAQRVDGSPVPHQGALESLPTSGLYKGKSQASRKAPMIPVPTSVWKAKSQSRSVCH